VSVCLRGDILGSDRRKEANMATKKSAKSAKNSQIQAVKDKIQKYEVAHGRRWTPELGLIVVEAWRDAKSIEGMPQSKFCKQVGITASRLDYWEKNPAVRKALKETYMPPVKAKPAEAAKGTATAKKVKIESARSRSDFLTDSVDLIRHLNGFASNYPKFSGFVSDVTSDFKESVRKVVAKELEDDLEAASKG
jgi:DNA-binding transcriptional regulator YiaG